MMTPALAWCLALALQPATPPATATPSAPSHAPPPSAAPSVDVDWRVSEAPYLSGAVQLTFPDRFVRAGEAYFDHESPPRWVVFQAVAKPPQGQAPDANYAMYVARLLRNDAGDVTGLDEPIRISTPASANTCGWFHPRVPGAVVYGSTLTAPKGEDAPGYQRGQGTYKWSFPSEMRVVSQVVIPVLKDALRQERRAQTLEEFGRWLRDMSGESPSPDAVEKLLERAQAEDLPPTEMERPGGAGYAAEGSVSPDGRYVLHTYRDEATKNPNIWIHDTFRRDKPALALVEDPGYDGGAFFSPDGRRIVYRSDRRGNSELQVFVADLVFDPADPGRIVGKANERQITSDEGVVNWAPYWSRDGSYLLFASSTQGHANYEIYAVRPHDPSTRVRVTFAPGFDGLPALSDDGALLMWTSQRGGTAPGEERASSQLWLAKVRGVPAWE